LLVRLTVVPPREQDTQEAGAMLTKY